MRGRKPKPAALKRLDGNPGKRKIVDPPKPPKGSKPPSPPACLSKLAKKEWRRLAKTLFDMGLLCPNYVAAFAVYCQAWADWFDSREELKKGLTVLTPNGFMQQSAFYSIANSALKNMKDYIALFGLSPVDIERLPARNPAKAGSGEKKKGSRWDELKARRNVS